MLMKMHFPTSYRLHLYCRRQVMAQAVNRRSYSTAQNGSFSKRIPPGTWDTHMHVVDPTVFPLDAAAQYKPSPHTIDQAKSFLETMGITKMVIVQPSIYGNDNSCTLDGLRKLGLKTGRAVIQFNPKTTTPKQLMEWHEIGVRGVRLNFKSVGVVPTAQELRAQLHEYAQAIGSLDWVLEVYISLENVPLLEQALQELPGVRICVDHLGHPSAGALKSARQAKDLEGFAALVRLLQAGKTWVKLSATYRLDSDPSSAVVESLAKELLRVRRDRCVFATDWPHTRFENIAVGAYVGKILDWIEEEGVSLEQVLVHNAEELFDAQE